MTHRVGCAQVAHCEPDLSSSGGEVTGGPDAAVATGQVVFGVTQVELLPPADEDADTGAMASVQVRAVANEAAAAGGTAVDDSWVTRGIEAARASGMPTAPWQQSCTLFWFFKKLRGLE